MSHRLDYVDNQEAVEAGIHVAENETNTVMLGIQRNTKEWTTAQAVGFSPPPTNVLSSPPPTAYASTHESMEVLSAGSCMDALPGVCSVQAYMVMVGQ